MKNYLTKLADYMDSIDKIMESNVIDALISKYASGYLKDLDTEDEPTEAYPLAEYDEEITPDLLFGLEEPISGSNDNFNKMLSDIELHPIGVRMLFFLRNVLAVADSGVDGHITMKDIRSVVNVAMKYNGETLEFTENFDDNLNPISLGQFKALILKATDIAKTRYSPKGYIDSVAVSDLISVLYKSFEEFYLEEYMRK